MGDCPHFSRPVNLPHGKLITAPSSFSLASVQLFIPINQANTLHASLFLYETSSSFASANLRFTLLKKWEFATQIWNMGSPHCTARIEDGWDLGARQLIWWNTLIRSTPMFGIFCQTQLIILAKKKDFVEKACTYCTVVVAKYTEVCLSSNSVFCQSWLFRKIVNSFQSEVKGIGKERIEHLGFNKNNFLFVLFSWENWKSLVSGWPEEILIFLIH